MQSYTELPSQKFTKKKKSNNCGDTTSDNCYALVEFFMSIEVSNSTTDTVQ